MRYRDEKPGDQDRARAAVKAWRAEHPDGVDRHMARAVTGITLNWPEPGR